MLYSFLEGSKAYLSGKRVLIDSANDFFIDYMQKNDDAKEVIKNAITEACGTRYGIGPYKKTDKNNKTRENSRVFVYSSIKDRISSGVNVYFLSQKWHVT